MFQIFSCSDKTEQEPKLDTFLCCGENPFSNSNIDNLDQTIGEIIPSGAFTPNGDGINDSFKIQNIEFYTNHSVIIYDIDNNIVYETTNYENNPFLGVNQSDNSQLNFGTLELWNL